MFSTLATMNLTEFIIILVIVLLVFGVGRLGQVGGELGAAIREFRKGLKGKEAGQTVSPDKSEKG